MALVERLCQIDVGDPGGEPQERHIALNPFCEALFSILGGYHTVPELKTFYAMTAEDVTEFDALVARVAAYPSLDMRMLAVHRVRSIMTFWEAEIPVYSTVTAIRNWLNTI